MFIYIYIYGAKVLTTHGLKTEWRNMINIQNQTKPKEKSIDKKVKID